MVVLVVRAQGDEGAEAHAVAVEDLRAGVLPHRHFGQFGQIRGQVEGDPRPGAGQRQPPHEEDADQEVGEDGAKVDELDGQTNFIKIYGNLLKSLPKAFIKRIIKNYY